MALGIYFSGQGIVQAAPVVQGAQGAFRDFGNAPTFDFALDYDFGEHYEARTGQRALDARITRQKKPKINAVFEDWNKDNLALFMQGAASTQSVTPVTGEHIAAALPAVGDILRLGAVNLSAVTIKDSSGSPKTLTLDTNYSLDAAYGEITILDITTGGVFVAPLTADYTPGAATNVNIMTQPEQEMMFRCKGVNTSDSNRKVLAEWWRVRMPTAKLIKMISDEVATPFEMELAVLADSTRTGGAMGPFGHFTLLP